MMRLQDRQLLRVLTLWVIKINEEKNAVRGTVDISADDATVKTLVIPTNEELMIAIDTKRLVEGK